MGNKKKEKAAKGRGMECRKADRRTRMNLWCVWLQISTGRYVLSPLSFMLTPFQGKKRKRKKDEKKVEGMYERGRGIRTKDTNGENQ